MKISKAIKQKKTIGAICIGGGLMVAILLSIKFISSIATTDTNSQTSIKLADKKSISEEIEGGLPDTPDEQSAFPSNTKGSKQIVIVPDWRNEILKERETLNLEDLSAENAADYIVESLDKALDGSVEAAFVSNAIRDICITRIPSDEVALENKIREYTIRAERRIGRGTDMPPEGVIDGRYKFGIVFNLALFATEQKNRQHLTQWYESCKQVKNTFDQTFLGQLEQLARQGHVMARYLYATWPIPWTIGDDTFEGLQLWQANALEFTNANLYSGEPAGLLAYGLSYRNTQFTPFNPVLGASLIIAAEMCGLGHSHYYDAVLKTMRDHDEAGVVWPNGITNEDLFRYAVDLTEYCK